MLTALRLMLLVLSIFIAVFFVKFTPNLLAQSSREANFFTQDVATCWVLWILGLYPILHMFYSFPLALRELALVSASLNPKSDTIRTVSNLHKTRRVKAGVGTHRTLSEWIASLFVPSKQSRGRSSRG